jgi:opacity protein-like surface antigen
MKVIGITSTCALALLLAVAAPSWAQEQHEQEQKEQPSRQEEKTAQPEKSAKEEPKPAAQQEKNAQEQHVKPDEKNANQHPEEKNAQQHAVQTEPGKQVRNTGGRIPDDRFKAKFGQQHKFRVSQAEYGRNRRFQYGGYSFGFVDPWPSNWLYTQDVYVVEIDGTYFLCNPSYPGVNIALSVVL